MDRDGERERERESEEALPIWKIWYIWKYLVHVMFPMFVDTLEDTYNFDIDEMKNFENTF